MSLVIDDIDSRVFIKLVERNPILWDKTHEYYKNKTATFKGWYDIAMKIIPTFDEMNEAQQKHVVKQVMSKWAYILNGYKKFIKKFEEKCTEEGKSTIWQPYRHIKSLQFMDRWYNPKNYDLLSITERYEPHRRSYDYKLRINLDPNSMKDKSETRPVEEDCEPVILKLKDFSPTSNHHVAFFESILPTLDAFEDDEIIEFQIKVLELLKKIKNSRQSESPSPTSPNNNLVAGATTTSDDEDDDDFKPYGEGDDDFKAYGEDSN